MNSNLGNSDMYVYLYFLIICLCKMFFSEGFCFLFNIFFYKGY